MSKIKSISRYTTTYNRANVYDDTIIESKYQASYLEMDEQGNIVEDKTFDSDENIENVIKRVFDSDNKMIEESLFDGSDDEPYEIRQFAYNEKGALSSGKISYQEDDVILKYIYSPEGKLLRKEITLPDGTLYIDEEYEWENDNLIKLTEYDEGDPAITKEMGYNEDGLIVEIKTKEHFNNDSSSEKYEYEGNQVVRQASFNYRGDLMTSIENEYAKELLVVKSVETSTQFFRHIYQYDIDGRKIQESIMNCDDLVLTDYITEYNSDGLELNTKIYSLNIVDNDDELILIEQYSYEYTFFD